MRKYFIHLFKLIVFWFLIFQFSRLLFICYFHSTFSGIPFNQVLMVFVKGFLLDISACFYLFILPFLVLTFQLFITRAFYKTFLKIYCFLLVVLNGIITVGDIGIYSEWGTKLNARAINNLLYPKEMFASVGSSPLLLFFMLVVLQALFGWLVFRLLFKKVPGKAALNTGFFTRLLIADVAIIFIAILCLRGGLQTIPINESAAYFSSKPILNHAAVNTCWFLFHSIDENSKSLNKNPYLVLNEAQAKVMVASLYANTRDSTVHLLTTNRPNIVFIQLESFTADVVKELGGDSGVTPNLSALIQQGVLFDNIYASGFRTDQGLVALMGGFPAQPSVSIIRQADKLERMPSLGKVMHSAGYYTSYYYGGEMNFANMNAYVHTNNFDFINGGDQFPTEKNYSKWGAPDEYVFQKQEKDIPGFPQPFFSYLVTLSSHEPFEVPMVTPFSGKKDLPNLFRHGIYYTDHCLGEYFNYIKTQPWYKNTLFVLVADHGHHLPRERLSYEPAHQYIPLVFFGEVIKPEYKGKRIHALGNQTDIAATLLAQLNLSHSQFNWSNNLMNAYRQPFAYYTFDDGFGWISLKDTFAYDNQAHRIIFPTNPKHPTDSTELRKGQAYLQELFNQYLSY